MALCIGGLALTEGFAPNGFDCDRSSGLEVEQRRGLVLAHADCGLKLLIDKRVWNFMTYLLGNSNDFVHETTGEVSQGRIVENYGHVDTTTCDSQAIKGNIPNEFSPP
ncbi:hypothetical protein N8586_04300 [Verrucomicrobiales bacterium]|nr:hypothetical protein [Verrucomicrobiales bacterium]